MRKLKRKYWYPISVSIELKLRKARIAIDRLYARTWMHLFALFLMLMVLIVYCAITYDRQWYREFANIDEPFSERFQHWNTDGSPGVPPLPQKQTDDIKKF